MPRLVHNGGGGPKIARSGEGRRSVTKARMAEAAESAPDQFKAIFLPYLPVLADVIKRDIEDRECVGHRTAMMAVMDGLRITRSSDQLIEAILTRLNLPDESSLEAAAGLYAAVKGQDMHEVYAECKRMVDWYESEVLGSGRANEVSVSKIQQNGHS